METSKGLQCVILGGGGHARVLVDCVLAGGCVTVYAVLDSDRSRWGKDVLGVPILGGDDLLPGIKDLGIDYFVVGLGSTGDNKPRQRLFDLGMASRLEPLTVVHPTAVYSHWAKVGPGSQLLPCSIVNVGARLGSNVVVNTGAIVEHDCVLGDHVHVSTGARLAGMVQVGACAHIGAGATVRQGITIGEGAIVGAGAVVVEDVPPCTVVAGVPARPLTEGKDELGGGDNRRGAMG